MRAVFAVSVAEHLTTGMATVALFTAMMDRCRPGHEGTDYTVQASVVVIATGAASASSGFIAERLGYPLHFALAAALSLAVLPLVHRCLAERSAEDAR
jgi:predicted MFS family arabinose efflux permease